MDPITEVHDTERRQIEFLNSYPALPATAPANYAHIIDLSTFEPSDDGPQASFEIQDTVVTMLYNISPDTLLAFLSPPKAPGSFKIVQNFIDSSSVDKLVIIRKGDDVMVGQFRDSTIQQREVFEFFYISRLTITNGRWDLTNASVHQLFPWDWDAVWSGQSLEMNDAFEEYAKSKQRDLTQVEYTFELAGYIMANKLWDASCSRWTTTIT